MCEHFIARAASPFRLDTLWPFAERLERFGIAGFGWGASWLDAAGRLASYRDVRAFRDDPGRDDGRLDRDDRRARPPAATIAAVDADAARHAAVRRPGRPVLVQPQRRPARLPIAAGDLSRAGSDPRPRRHGGRRSLAGGRLAARRAGRPPAGRAPRPVRGPGQPGRPRRRRHAASLRGQRREPGLRLPAGARSGSCRPASTRSIDRSSGSSRRAPPTGGSWPLRSTVALGPDGTALAVA